MFRATRQRPASRFFSRLRQPVDDPRNTEQQRLARSHPMSTKPCRSRLCANHPRKNQGYADSMMFSMPSESG
jgi:hypothetical protein